MRANALGIEMKACNLQLVVCGWRSQAVWYILDIY